MAAWYIDTWSVLDGIAFVSLREPWDDDAVVLTPAETTVMIAPPDWRAVSIARLSTALAATRTAFQEGFYNLEGEVAFPSLDTVRTVVRRAYIAGALGLDSSGGEGVVIPAEPLLPPGGSNDWKSIRRRLLNSSGGAEVTPVVEEFKSFVGRHADELWDALAEFSSELQATTERTWGSSSSDEERFRDRQDLLGFYRLNFEMGRREPYFIRDWNNLSSVRPRLRLLLRMPAARRFPGYPEVTTVADQLCLVAASRTCFEALDTMRDVLPILFAGVVVASNGGLPNSGAREYRTMTIERAASWVSDLVPERLLDLDGKELVDLEALLEELIQRIAQMRHHSDSGPEAPPSKQNPGPGSSFSARPEVAVVQHAEPVAPARSVHYQTEAAPPLRVRTR